MTEQDNWESHDWSPADHNKCRRCGAPITDKQPCPFPGTKDMCPHDGAPCWIAGTPEAGLDDRHWRCGTSSCGLSASKGDEVETEQFIRSLSRVTLEALCIKQHGDLVKAERQHAPGIIEEACEWMMARSYATGHGDSISDLMAELAEQIRERAIKECAIVAEGVRDNSRRTADDSWREASGLIVGRMRALAITK